uniref:Elongator complex protein 5 n=1 Tax=Anolis carolinensis TaxID=28377 RepID=H9GUJ5_ANOCA
GRQLFSSPSWLLPEDDFRPKQCGTFAQPYSDVRGAGERERERARDAGGAGGWRSRGARPSPRLFIHDGFRDPLGWSGARGGLTVGDFSAPQLVLRFSQAAQGPATLALDSLSWLLLRLPFPSVCQVLAQLPKKANTAGVRIRTLVALLHGDLHPPEQLKALHSLARVVVTLKQGDGSPRVAVTLHRKRRNKVVQKKEYFTVLSGFALKHLGEPSPAAVSGEEVIQKDDASAVADPTANLTFNLRLSEAERRAKESVPLPYQFSEEKKSSLLQGPTGQGKIYYEPDAADDIDDEDPDDDLDV